MSAALPREEWRAFRRDASEERRLEALLALIERDARAPTSVRDPDEGARVHIADSLAALSLPQVRAARTIVDVGSGSGFPGLPLAVALPAAAVVLLESQSRKCDFLGEAALAARATNVSVICARAESWASGLGDFDVATARALGPQPVVLEYAAPLLRVGGVLVDWRGRRNEDEEAAALHAASELGMERLSVERSQPFAAARAHHLHVFAKTGATPERFPRRPGIARKRPLG
jgi:16S rRNA (guanine527-N7)-methyltransferase